MNKKYFNEILQDQNNFFKAKYKLYNTMKTRGANTPEERQELYELELCCLAIFRELEELQEMAKQFNTKYRGFYIRGEFKPDKNGNVWPNFYTLIKILVAGEENKGPQEKFVNLKFNPNIDISFLREGYLTAEKSKSTRPKIYEIKEIDGVKKYPYIWIDEIYSFEPTVAQEEKENETKRFN